MDTVEIIKEHFPNPSKTTPEPGRYCVGAALWAHMSGLDEQQLEQMPAYVRFPRPHLIAELLKEVNPSLSNAEAENFALTIMVHNEFNQIEKALAVLAEAMQQVVAM